MKRLYIAVLAVLAAALFGVGYNAYAADYGTSSGESGYSHEMSGTPGAGSAAMHGKHKTKTMYGFIVDTKCMSSKEAKKAEKEGKLDAFAKEHSKQCILACKSGGCGFYSEGRLYRVDKASSHRIEAFLKQPDNDPHIKADVYPSGKGTVGLINLHNAI
jgi:hypothetical protein